MQNRLQRLKTASGIIAVFLAVTVVLLIAWNTGPFFYHFGERRLVTLYSLFQLLITAYIALLACRSLEEESSLKWQKNSSARPFFISAIGFLYLGCDEIFSLHENIDKLIHHILFLKETPVSDHLDDFILLAYGVVAIFFIKDFFREFKRHPFMIGLIIGGFSFFFMMSCLDYITNSVESFMQFFYDDIPRGNLLHERDILRQVEDSAKLTGEAFFFSAFLAALMDIKSKKNPEYRQ